MRCLTVAQHQHQKRELKSRRWRVFPEAALTSHASPAVGVWVLVLHHVRCLRDHTEINRRWLDHHSDATLLLIKVGVLLSHCFPPGFCSHSAKVNQRRHGWHILRWWSHTPLGFDRERKKTTKKKEETDVTPSLPNNGADLAQPVVLAHAQSMVWISNKVWSDYRDIWGEKGRVWGFCPAVFAAVLY